MRPIPASGRLWPRNVCMSMLSNMGAGGVQGAMEVVVCPTEQLVPGGGFCSRTVESGTRITFDEARY